MTRLHRSGRDVTPSPQRDLEGVKVGVFVLGSKLYYNVHIWCTISERLHPKLFDSELPTLELDKVFLDLIACLYFFTNF